MMDIIYFKTSDSSFIVKDQHIIEKNFRCKPYKINTSSALKYFFSLIQLTLFLLFSGWKYKLFIIRFADWHTAIITFFKRLYKKRLIVIIGGFDVSCIPELNYGVHTRLLRSIAVRYTLKKADLLLPNHHKLMKYESSFGLKNIHKGGILEFANVPESKIKVLYNGYDDEQFFFPDERIKEELALTVAKIPNERTYKLKGIQYFIEAAFAFPEKKFVIIGLSKLLINKRNIKIPDNLDIIEEIPYKDLLAYYQKAKIFCIFSLSEGMPNVLCEAMLCECIPVGSNASSIPEIIGKNGFIVKNTDISHIISQIENAFKAPQEMGKSAREFIKTNFSLKKRESDLIYYIKQML